jgi:aspartate kinase
MIVQKFGGTSVQDTTWIERVLQIAEDSLDRAPVMVASAMGKTTDALAAVAELAADGEADAAHERIDALWRHHSETLQSLVGDAKDITVLGLDESPFQRIERLFQELRALVRGMILIRECTARTQDALLSFGELLSTTVIAAAAGSRGMSAQLLDSRSFIVTDEHFTAANPDLEATTERVRKLVVPEAGKLLIAQGFIASTRQSVTSTLGRGGSDYSATLIGAALEAEEVQIWTDVDGIMTSDPRIIAEARSIPEISYSEAAELAYFGARVVHPSTIQPAIEDDIPVIVRNTARPEHPGTRITAASQTRGVQALAEKRGITVITVHSYRMLNAYGFLSSLFAVFAQHQLSVDLVATSEVSVSITIDRALDLSPVVRDLEQYGRVEIEHHKGIVCLVGQDLWKDSRVVARVFNVLADVPLRMISLGSSDTNLSLVVSEEDTEDAIRRLHREFFSE